MLILEQIMEIKVLYKQGKSLRTIAVEVGVSVNTVRKYSKHDGTPKYKVRPPLVTKLAPYKEYLSNRIKSAHPLPLPGTVLFQEIKGVFWIHCVNSAISTLNSILKFYQKMSHGFIPILDGHTPFSRNVIYSQVQSLKNRFITWKNSLIFCYFS